MIERLLACAAVLVATPVAAQVAGRETGPRTDWAAPRVPAPAPTPARDVLPPLVAGTLVLGKYQGGAHWYPAQVIEVRGNLVTLEYSGGGREALPKALIRRLAWSRGALIECKLATKTYEPVTITAMGEGYAIDVVSNTGRRQTSSIRFCRTAAPRA